MKINFPEIIRQLKKNQSKSRFRHSLSVGRFAARLGAEHGWDPQEARLTGLLHDWAKERSPQSLLKSVRKFRLKIPGVRFIMKYSPNVMHGFVGAAEVKKLAWIKNPRALRAIEIHTMGEIKMSLQDKILFIADTVSPDRRWRKAAEIRRQAMKDLDGALAAAIASKIKHNLKKGRPIHPFALKVWNRQVCHLSEGDLK